MHLLIIFKLLNISALAMVEINENILEDIRDNVTILENVSDNVAHSFFYLIIFRKHT